MAAAAITVSPEDVAQAARTSERIPEPCVVVIFGASGDLTKRKLLPALFHLEQAGLLPEQFRIVGVARRDLGASFAEDMKSGILEFGGVKPEASKLDEFIDKVSYHAMNFDDDAGYSSLKSLLEKCDRSTEPRATGCFTSPSHPNISRTLFIASARTAWRSRSMEPRASLSKSPSATIWKARAS